MGKPIKMDDLGVPPIFGNSHTSFKPSSRWTQDCSARLFKRCVEGLGHDTLMAARQLGGGMDGQRQPEIHRNPVNSLTS